MIIVDSLESYTYGEFKSDQYSSLWKIDKADNLLPPSEAQQETSEICHDDHKGLACAPDLPLEFHDDVRVQHRLTATTIYSAHRPREFSVHISTGSTPVQENPPVRVPGRSDL